MPDPSPAGGFPTAPGAAITSHRSMLLLVLLSLLLKSLIFAPIGLWPLAFVCLVPWLLTVVASTNSARVYLYSYAFGLAFFLINVRWLCPVTILGYIALSVYLACYFPLIACPVRHLVRRRGWPLAVLFPLIWVGGEMLRAVVMSGFPWFFLSHSLYRVLTLIQVSDLVGAYGVSFVVACVNGAIGDIILRWRDSRSGTESPLGRVPILYSIACAGGLVLLTGVYGQYQLHRNTTSTGPRIAVLQGDFLNLLDADQAVGHDRFSDRERMQVYLSMMREASAQKPDLYLLPESPWRLLLNKEARGMYALSRESFQALGRLATQLNGYVVTGSASRELDPYSLMAQRRDYNSATLFYPDGREPGRYDKVHLVYFGEIVPFRFGRLRSVYLWLNRLMPFSEGGEYEYSLFRGDEFRVFSIKPASQPGKVYRFGIPICYEDVMPYVSREFVWGGSTTKRADILLNISNDGWFGRGSQQPQHLAICAFRAVENRVGIARAVNTGVSAFIDPSGRIHDVVTSDPTNAWPGRIGYAVANVSVDSRYTLYSRYGDWFGWSCAALWLIFFGDYWMVRAKRRTQGAASLEAESS
ncbi:MAG: apolipoprotein N-acyltransferase [Planctomycetes bacterium]|nr:apolipoprotein N-acyltransferase [Planctomycetota bacterium]